jgi:hypothetical protein
MYSADTVIHPVGTMPKETAAADLKWPEAGLTVIPDWIYTSEEVYRREVERIFHGRTWNFVALEAEIPNPGDYKRSFVGPTPVVVARDEAGEVNVFENRCAHRGAEFCRAQRERVRLPLPPVVLRPEGQPAGHPVQARGEEGGRHALRLQERGPRPEEARRDAPSRRGVRLLRDRR